MGLIKRKFGQHQPLSAQLLTHSIKLPHAGENKNTPKMPYSKHSLSFSKMILCIEYKLAEKHKYRHSNVPVDLHKTVLMEIFCSQT